MTGSNEVERGRCMRGSDGRLRFSEKKRGKVYEDWDHNVGGDAVESSVVCVSRDDVVQALCEMKTGIAS